MKIYEVVNDDDSMITYGLFSSLEKAKDYIKNKEYRSIIYETEVDGGKGLDSSKSVYQNYDLES